MRFKGVGDVGRLERQLDNLIIGGLKLHVNIPKHGRERTLNGEPNSEEKYKVGIDSKKIIEGVKGKYPQGYNNVLDLNTQVLLEFFKL